MKWILAIAALMLATAGTAVAQDDSATLLGRVTDPSKAVVFGATVVVRNLDTNAVRTVTTNKQGEYNITGLTAGEYDVLITMATFKEAEEPTITLQTGQQARFDVTLQVGSVNEKITVTTEVGALHTDTSDKGDVIAPIEISEMPLNGRDFNDLVFNVAGVAPSEEGSKGAEFVANGVRSDQSNIIVDGVNNTNPRDSTAEAAPPLDALQEFKVQTSGYSAEYGRVAGPVVNLTIKKGGNVLRGSVFEFVRNDFFDAHNFFDVPGTKSELRRNQFGGTLAGPVTIPHIYNGHDKTFFLLSEESYRQVAGENAIGIVPSLAERSGDFSKSYNTFTGVPFNTPQGTNPPLPIYNPTTNQVLSNFQLPSTQFDPTAVMLMNAFYPLPTTGVTLPGANNYIVNKKGYTYWDTFVVKVDQQLHAHDEASVKYLLRHEHTTKPFSNSSKNGTITAAGSDLGNFTGQWPALLHNVQTIVAINETHIFSSSLINDFRSGLTRNVNSERPEDAGTNWASLLGIPGSTSDPNLAQFPYFNVSGYDTLGDNTQEPVTYTSNNFDTNDTLTWSKGKHTVKFGGDRLHVQYYQPTNSEYSGDLGFSGRATLSSGGANKTVIATAQNGFLEFLAGYVSTVDLRTGIVSNHIFDTSWAAFVQDDYKILSGLTLNLGLRYELETLPYEQKNQFSNYIPSLGKAVLAATETPAIDALLATVPTQQPYITFADQVGLPRTLIYPNHNRVAPRVGFAWRPSLNDQSVIRGGYGIFFTGSRLTAIRTELSGQFPFSVVSSCGPSGFFNAFTSCSSKFSTINGYDPHAPSSYVQSFNLTYERELPKGMAMEIAYTGSKGTHLGRQYDINQQNPAFGGCTFKSSGASCNRTENAAGVALYPSFDGIDFFSFNAYSNYNAGTATLRKRFEHGLLFRLNFTYAKSLDLASGLNAGGKGGYSGAQDSQHPTAEYGRSDFDRKFVLNGNFVYMLPFTKNIFVKGWELAGSEQIDSGTPFTPQLDGPNPDGPVATRPNRVCNGALAHPNVNAWFNTACFPQVPATTLVFGTSGRNILTGPKLVVINMSLSRNFRIKDKQKLQFRWEVFNVPNHPNLNTPNDGVDQPDVATITSAKDPRVMQIGAKYEF